MKLPLFEFPSFIYQIDDWEFKKKSLLARINKSEFVRTDLQHFETDRKTNGKTYVRYLEEVLEPQLMEFCKSVLTNSLLLILDNKLFFLNSQSSIG